MVNVTVEGYKIGDGFLTVPWREWVNDRAEYSEEYTESLAEWIKQLDHTYPEESDILAWARARQSKDDDEPWGETSGLYGDGDAWNLYTDGDNLLDCGLFRALFFHTANGPTLYVLTCYPGTYSVDTRPDVYEWTGDDDGDAADWSRAYGRCTGPDAHEWDTEDTVYMVQDGRYGMGEVRLRISDRVMVPPDICTDTTPYVRCTCGHPVEWSAS